MKCSLLFVAEGSGLANGKWHAVRAEVAADFVKLMVNDDTQEVPKALSVRTGGDYFIGGSSKSFFCVHERCKKGFVVMW